MNSTYSANETHTASSSDKVKNMVIAALFIALTFVFTNINIQLPIGGKGGLVHLGNIPFFIAAILFGKKIGAVAGGVGMAVFDLLSPWTIYAPFTLVIVGLMGFVTGAITEKKKGTMWNIIAMLAALVIKIVGYYIAEVILYGSFLVPIASIPGNVLQVGTAIIIVAMLAPQLKKAAKKIL